PLRPLFKNDATPRACFPRWSSTAVYRARHGPRSQRTGSWHHRFHAAGCRIPRCWSHSPASEPRMSCLVPDSFSELVTGREPEPHISGDLWLTQLPRLVEESLTQWDLTLDGDSMHGMAALVLPVRRRDDSAAVLKVTWPCNTGVAVVPYSCWQPTRRAGPCCWSASTAAAICMRSRSMRPAQ